MFLALLLLQAAAAAQSNAPGPFEFFQPTVNVSASEQSVLDRGAPISRVLPGRGEEDGIFTAVPAKIDGNRLVAWERHIDELKEGGYTLAIRRFSNPPRIEDLGGLELDRDDLADIRRCRPGSCQLKLSADEMTRLRQAAAHSAGDEATQQAFRQVVLDRVQLYMTKGQIPPYQDGHTAVQPETQFATLLHDTEFLSKHAPELAAYLQGHSSAQAAGVESFFYWSKERVAGKPIISVTHVNIMRFRGQSLPDALVVSQDIFSSHYINASLSVTALMPGGSDHENYLVYVNRSEVDIIHGMFAGMIRKEIHRRLRSDTTKVLQTYRERMESGEPPQPASAAGAVLSGVEAGSQLSRSPRFAPY
jgi:hypothetical protein